MKFFRLRHRFRESGARPGRPIRRAARTSAEDYAVLDLARAAVWGALAFVLILALPAQAQQQAPKPNPAHVSSHGKSAAAKSNPAKRKSSDAASAAPGAASAPEAPAAEPPPPYEAQVLRLAEILGALSYLDELCGSTDAGEWRARMQALLDAEAKTAYRKERLAGTFNRSFRGYERSYRVCTPNAQVIISRFLAEGGRLAHEVVNRFSAS